MQSTARQNIDIVILLTPPLLRLNRLLFFGSRVGSKSNLVGAASRVAKFR